jgi:hypothetical protein
MRDQRFSISESAEVMQGTMHISTAQNTTIACTPDQHKHAQQILCSGGGAPPTSQQLPQYLMARADDGSVQQELICRRQKVLKRCISISGSTQLMHNNQPISATTLGFFCMEDEMLR